MPKRKFAECGSDGQEEGESEDSNCSSVQTDGSTDVATKSEAGPYTQARKKAKKSVSFQGVTVYYFPRKQGFTCVPSQGGSTLGMSEKHHGVETFSLSEYSTMQRSIHNQYLLEQHQQGKIILPPEKLVLITEGSEHGSTRESPAASDEDEDDLGLDDDYYFLQPVPTRQRRVMLRQSGIKKIEPVEKDECKDIRSSREVCGCNCKVFCDPDTCICSKAGIKCQVDRLSFPCGCSKDGCANVNGRIEFNPIRVRTHFLHTLMRIEFEKKKGQMLGDRGILKPHKLAACQVKQDLKTASMGSSSQVMDAPCKDSGTCSAGQQCPSGADNNRGSTLGTPQPANATRDETDLIQTYNSNERGSCRDCQKSDISELIMRESQFTAQSAELDSCMGANRNFTMPEEPHIGLPTVTNAGESLPQLMMFSDDEEAYNADNNAAMFQFPKEESSYSESSDCSSEGAGSVEEQPVYRNYHNFPAPYQGGPEGPQCNNRVSLHTRSHTSGQALEQGMCEYRHDSNHGNAGHRTACAAEQKYSDLSNPAVNGYKLEPISEILTPLRYPGYPGSPAAGPNATSGHWAPEGYSQGHYSKAPVHGAMVGPAGDCSSSIAGSNSQFPPCTVTEEHLMTSGLNHGSQFMYTTTCPDVKPTESRPKNSQLVNGDTPTSSVSTAATNLPYSSPTHYSNSQPVYNGTEPSTGSKAVSTTHEASDDKPKYHELKSSSKPSANSSLAYLSTANQVTASFDLTNRNVPSTVATFHLASNCSSAQSCANGMTSTGPGDLYGLPRPQTAQPVTSFELPNITTETEGPEVDTNGNEADPCCHQSASPSCDQSTTTQNFGEIIKESIVETVSA